MRRILFLLVTLGAASPIAAQSFTGEFRVLGFAAYAPEVSRATGYQDPTGSPGVERDGGRGGGHFLRRRAVSAGS